MAEALSKEQDSFKCPVCLGILKDPVTIPCGHNFCMECINRSWNENLEPFCPMCKQTFSSRPELSKNSLMAEMVDKFGKTTIQATDSAHCSTGDRDVECDICTTEKLKAIKFCLDCNFFYCENHFRLHNELNPGRKHSVKNVAGKPQEEICPLHRRVFHRFCRTEQTLICSKCLTICDSYSHETVTTADERIGKRDHLSQTKSRYQQRIQEREKELQELEKAVKTLQKAAQTAVDDSVTFITDILKQKCSDVTDMIRAQEKAEVSWAEGLLKRLKQEIDELKSRHAELEKLSHTEDDIHFLKNLPLDRDPIRSKDLPSMTVNQNTFEEVKNSVSSLKTQLEEKLESFFNQQVNKISEAVMGIQIIQSYVYADPDPPVKKAQSASKLPPKMSEAEKIDGSSQGVVFELPTTQITELPAKDELLKYSCHLTLDPNTAHKKLHLSEGNRRVERKAALLSYPDHPKRFVKRTQVLCREGVSGRCYWEVEYIGEEVYIAVSYESINSEGKMDENAFGSNGQSWALAVRNKSSSFRHNNDEIKLPLVASSRIGVYVDHRAGTLAFYSISDTMTLLHRVQTTFTHTLYPGFCINNGSVKLL